MLNDILEKADLYATGLKNVQERRASWLVKHKELKEYLKKVADYLNNNAAYKPGYFIDVLHAFNENMDGICTEMPSLIFRTGDMPMLVTFKNSLGERKDYIEEGFSITFNPVITGEVVVILLPHNSELNKNPPQYTTLGIIHNPAEFTMDMADELISRGIEAAFYTSFTGIAELRQNNEDETPVPRHAPIGFKRYETTEKVD